MFTNYECYEKDVIEKKLNKICISTHKHKQKEGYETEGFGRNDGI